MDRSRLAARASGASFAVAGVVALSACTAQVDAADHDVIAPTSPSAVPSASPSTAYSPLGDANREVVSCSDLGNAEGVGVDLTTAVPLEGGDYYATVSVPSLGVSETTGFAGNDEYGLSGGVQADLGAQPVVVDVRVVTERGDVVYEASTTATPHLFQPNGALCDGENYRIGLRGLPGGELVAWDWQKDGEARDELGRVSLPVFTECGVLTISDGYSSYRRVGGRLDDGAGGPPPGWNVPYQRGWAAIEGDTLAFQDERGHSEVFQRVAADEAVPSCS